jgi:outer membrane protease
MRTAWILLLGLCSAAAWSQDLKPRFDLGTGVVWGQATELVLRDGTYDNSVSRLQWDLPPALVIRASADWPWADWTSTRIEAETAIPLKTGIMVDEDWETGSTVDDLVYGHSSSTAELKSRWAARLEQAFTWNGIRFLGGGRVMYTSWDAVGGTYDYSYVGSSSQHNQHETGDLPTGTAITYQQTWLMPYVGVEHTWDNQDSSLTVTLRGFPWAICWDVDDHVLRDITFDDLMHGGWYGQGSVELAVPGEWQWGFRLSGEMTWGAAGDTLEKDSGSSTTYANTAGAWFYEASLAFFVRN